MFKVLIMGLPGSGKTTLAKALQERLVEHKRSVWLNADTVRAQFNDWDFSYEGRMRQARRLVTMAQTLEPEIAIVDFVAALKEQRKEFNPDFTIWMDTISEGRFDDTNKAFEPPLAEYNLRLTSFKYNINIILGLIIDSL